jgi:hypothetical protein
MADMQSSYPMADNSDVDESGGGDGEIKEDDGTETSILPKSMFSSQKVGDTVSVKLVGEMEDGFEVRCVKEGDEEMDEAGGDREGLQGRMMAHMGSGRNTSGR